LKKAYDLDPYDLQAIISLGISCTNEKEHSYALRHLKTWLKNHPDYCDLQDVHSDNVEIDEVQKKFSEANMKNP